MNYRTFTSESVASGHPDKICDQISDAILDQAITADPHSRVAIETLVTKNRIVLAGEITCPKRIYYQKIARQVVKKLGFTKDIFQFSDRSPISVYLHEQSPDIAAGVDDGGAGDQGMMFGYASDETPQLMPLPIVLSHRLVQTLDQARENKTLPYLRPDGKSEVTVSYYRSYPVKIEKVVLAVPHSPRTSRKKLTADIYSQVVTSVLKEFGFKIKVNQLIVNGTGRWEIGGPASDTGVTGRKIMVDSYGGMSRQGGGCFSGKDPTKVDRSGAYAARFIAKNIVAAGLARRCEIQLAYVIGRQQPISREVETFGTARASPKAIRDFAFHKLIDLSVKGIIDQLKLRRPIYQRTARYGHFGHPEFPWEITEVK